ncbi:AzlC family ABC transporter permease [Fusobacterium simiae]|uniref:AzlC family ABC transporter permease n=1 Tax=Fusobacterium simiae TaxID=855 RepID=A0ABT4DIX2_FUSSI|nr:AzlC family ABC transporter permease [Fusobacterium simiae]MCY7008408.1 AzlC family ABC transporter permease [Fusobacterium simiae]
MEEFKFALKKYILIAFAYLFIGMTCGLLMKEAGYGVFWSFFSSAFVYGGTIQLLMVGLLKAHTPIITIGLISIFVNSRHMFYGLTYLEEFKEIRKKSFLKFLYLSLTLTDEVYSLYTSSKFPERLDRVKTMLWINALSYFTWMFGCIAGNVAFNFINFSLEGIDFIITEFFCIVVISQLINDKSYISTSVGIISSIVAFLIVVSNFILLAIIFSMLSLLLLKNKVDKKEVDKYE